MIKYDLRQDELDGAFRMGLIIAEIAVAKHVKGPSFNTLSEAIFNAGVEEIGKDRMGKHGVPGYNEGKS
jgi:hypothetical protein